MAQHKLIRDLAASAEVRSLADLLSGSAPHHHEHRHQIRVAGLSGSALNAVVASLLGTGRTLPTLLIVAADAEQASFCYGDLSTLLPAGMQAMLFPSSFRRAIKYKQRDSANEIMRTEVLSALSSAGTAHIPCIVTSPEALAEAVRSKSDVSKNSMSIGRGDTLDFTDLEERLESLGFERVDYVAQPGQYAMRGSIVDIFSYASELPYRLDFFGDDIDSIRTFDTTTQLSIEQVSQMSVVGNLTDNDGGHDTFFSFMPTDSVIITRDMGYLNERIHQIIDEGISHAAKVEEGTDASPSPLITANEWDRAVMPLRSVVTQTDRDSADVNFDTTPQPLFHKNFDLLGSECQRLLIQGYAINILADSQKQLDRLAEIFTSFTPTITFTAIQGTIHEGFISHTLRQAYLTDHQIFERFHRTPIGGERVRNGRAAITLKELQGLQIGDYVVHIDHGIGRFGGLVNVPSDTGRGYQEMIKISYLHDDTVYVSIHALHKVSKYKGREGEAPRLSNLGTGAWERMKERVKTKVKDIARDLIRLYAQRLHEQGYAYSRDSYMQHELEASFIYEDTPDQLKATQDVKTDMESPHPMDRLICGDVGFGKTEVAVRAAFKAAADGKQTAVLVPTTVLAYQHYQTFSSRLRGLPVSVDYLSRARTTAEQKQLLADLEAGKIDIIIGTHKLIGKSVKFKDLGLLIIDEEQKFGVAVKEKLRYMRAGIDTLTMTATPIPRTLQFSLMGARDLSVISTPPPNRYPIHTELHTFSAEIIAEAINYEMARNGQVFFVNNRINNLPELAAMIKRAVPDARIGIGHGRMDPKEMERVVMGFMNYEYDVLLSTTIIENGIDVPNANTIIINAAHNYGLSDLHQMRGRVGRSNKKAFCYLLAPPLASLPDDSRRRLTAIETFSELGSGLNIAMQDLDIRGAGNLLGAEQSGFIADLGYETYQKVLAEAMDELKHSEAQIAQVQTQQIVNAAETTIDSDLAAYFSETFVPSSTERVNLYRELDNLTDANALDMYRSRLIDRFGQPPFEAEELMRIMPLKWAAAKLGIERITLKRRRMICYFPADKDSTYYQSDAFGQIIEYAAFHPRQCQLRDERLRSLLVTDVTSVEQALNILQGM